jgi:hypothetical protein
MRRTIVTLFLGVLVSAPASAAEQWVASTIKYVYPLSEGSVVLAFHVDSAACPATGSPKYYYLQVGQNGVTADGITRIFAAAVAAAAAGNIVHVAYDNATSNCYINRLAVIYD